MCVYSGAYVRSCFMLSCFMQCYVHCLPRQYFIPFLPFLLDDSSAAVAADKVTVAAAAASFDFVRRTTALRVWLEKSNALWVMMPRKQ